MVSNTKEVALEQAIERGLAGISTEELVKGGQASGPYRIGKLHLQRMDGGIGCAQQQTPHLPLTSERPPNPIRSEADMQSDFPTTGITLRASWALRVV